LKSEGHDSAVEGAGVIHRGAGHGEAKKLLLAASSQYAEFEQDEFIAFASDLDLDFLNNEIVIPGISIDEFMNAREDVRGVDVAPSSSEKSGNEFRGPVSTIIRGTSWGYGSSRRMW
jgi:hypothetical protein